MSKKNNTSNITLKCVVFGIIAALLTDAIFYLVFPSAWVFFIIPAFMAFTITKFVKFPNEMLQDEEEFNRLSKRTGITFAAICLGAIILAITPVLFLDLLLGTNIIMHLLCNVLFYVVAGLAVYTGYNRGVEIVTNAYYDSLNEL